MRRKTTLEIDEELVDEVRQILGTRTLKDTVEAAFREVTALAARRRELERLSRGKGTDIDRADVRSRAWR